MNKKYIWYSIFFLAFSCSPKPTIVKEDTAQEIPVPLMTIGNEDIFADEFLYLLSKNRQFQDKSEKISPEEFEENFELFINYKLKVKEAENLGLDTLEEFKREFEIFKEDLIKPFLIKNSLQEGELMKAYNRMKEVVKASHILLQFPNNSSREDTIAVFRMAQKLKAEAEAGADFNELAEKYSDDPSAKDNKGSLGYFTALQMVHQFEDAAYSLQIGQISDPVLTNFGYHIIKLEDRKPNPGEIRVSHILIRTQEEDPIAEERSLRKVGDIYTELQKPESNWEEVCSLFSEDMGSKNSGGLLPWLSLGSVIPEFERVAFSLTEIGEISPPVKTPYGYHIIRLEDRRPISSYEEMEPVIKSRILRDSRSTLIQSQVVAIQKSRYSFEENEPVIHEIQNLYAQHPINDVPKIIDSMNLSDSTIFSIQEKGTSVIDFMDFIQAGKQNVRPGMQSYFEAWYDKFVEISLSNEEEKDLMENNKEYKLLLNEYRDGILLFSLMNENVWQKALMDSVGQVEFYEENKDKYTWKQRVRALIVTMGNEESTASVRRFLSDKKYRPDLSDRLENTFLLNNPLAFVMEEGLFEWESHPVLQKADLNKSFQELKFNEKIHFILIGEKLAPEPKKFAETRGKVIQDYQQFLDEKLIASLKENYIIRINEDEKQKLYDIAVEK
ncbi:peptidylprolyl isomerase [Shivajiella indica]|uniref:Peptidylprolyl isomerase n=1 Tax=Shivajiella indica TaxID=872115 RepID=A0ABW5B563_9BACT